MNFNEKLSLIIKTLKCKNIELAKTSNLDATIISRFRMGTRIPTKGSKVLDSIVKGLCTITLEKNKEKQIKNLCKSNSDSLYSSIMDWFCMENSNIKNKVNINSFVGKNYETLLQLFDISNVKLAKDLNIDPSLLSKYKNNVRALSKNDSTATKICEYFIDISTKKNQLNILTSTIKIEYTENIDLLKMGLLNFLFDTNISINPIDSLLLGLNDFSFDTSLKIPELNKIVSNEILNDNISNYYGTSEFRNAVKKFLGNIIINENPTVLKLYSDENIVWLTKDKTFFNSWKILMVMLLMKKNKIKIIHNINRNPLEMFDAIEGWLPLYMTGQISPYYLKKPLNLGFNHTIFLAEGLSALTSFSVRGAEKEGLYQFSNDNKILQSYLKQYDNMLEKSAPLVKIYVGKNINTRLNNISEYKKYTSKKLENIEILLQKDMSTLVLKTNTPSILFEFEHPLMNNAFEHYIETYIELI